MALLSKISQLPKRIREELNNRLDDGQLGPEILGWLNPLPEVQELLARKFKGVPISDQNLSTWRETGYCLWQQRQQRIHELRAKQEVAVKMAESGKDLFAGASAIAAGHIMEVLENVDIKLLLQDASESPETLTGLFTALAKLTAAQDQQERTKLAKQVQQTNREKLKLDQDKFELLQIKAVLKHAQSKEIQQIANGSGSNAEKIKALRERMFPKRQNPNQTNLPLSA